MYNRFENAHAQTGDVYASASIAFLNAAKRSTGNIYDFSTAEQLLCKTYPEHSNTIKTAMRDVENLLGSREG